MIEPYALTDLESSQSRLLPGQIIVYCKSLVSLLISAARMKIKRVTILI